MSYIKAIINYLGYLNVSDDGFHITFEQLMWIIFALAFLTLAIAPFGGHIAGFFNRADAKLDSYTF